MLRRAGLNLAAQVLSLAMSVADRLIVVGLIIRSWGTEIYADWAALLAAASMLGLAEMGMNIYFGNVWQQARARDDDVAVQRALGTSLFVYACLGLPLAIGGALALATFNIPAVLSIKSIPISDARAVLAVLGAAMIVHVMRGSIAQLYRGHQEFARGTLVDLATSATIVGASVLVAALGGGPLVLALCYLASELVAGWAFMLADIKRRYRYLVMRPAWPARDDLTSLATKLPWIGLQQGAPLLWLQVPVIALGSANVAAASLVSFVLLRTLTNLARQISSTLSLAVGVEMAGVHHAGNSDAAAHQLVSVGRLTSTITVVGAVGLFLLAEPFVLLWTGRPGLFNATVLAWLVIGALIAAPAVPFMAVLNLINEPRPAALATLIQVGTGLLAILILVPIHGAAGAAAGLALGELAGAGLALPLLARRNAIGVDYLRYAAGCYGYALLTGLWTGAVALALAKLLPTRDPASLLLAGALFAIFGAAPALLSSLPATARQRVSGYLR